MKERQRVFNIVGFIALLLISILWLVPLALVLMNSFKGNLFISQSPFALPDAKSFLGVQNYTSGVARTGFFVAAAYSLLITVSSVAVIILLASMAAWYIARVKAWYTSALYYALVFSMIVPFQMVMFTMSKVANMTHLDNPGGIIVLYAGFGAGLSVFICVGFVRSIPVEIEEAAMIDGASPWKAFFLVVFPILKPTIVTIAILNTMWVWNDYLLPYIVIGSHVSTIPVAVQKYMVGAYGYVDMGAFMAMLVLAIVPIVIFFISSQKYIVKGVAAGAIKG